MDLRVLEREILEMKDRLAEQAVLIEKQAARIEDLEAENAAQAEETAALRTENANLKEQTAYLTRKLFGTSSEKRDRNIEGQLSFFNEAEAIATPEEEDVPPLSTQNRTRKKRRTHAEQFKGLPVKEVLIELPEDQQFCPNCGTKMVPIGKELVREELQITPARGKVVRYLRVNYGCPDCKTGESGSEKACIKKADVPEPVIPHSFASPSAVAHVMYQKYALSLPLARQESDFKRLGIPLSRATARQLPGHHGELDRLLF